ncbi:partial Na(+)-translocating ferredoxin:NAD(+) oxidoreductase complex subunit C, partial [Anaerolineae bacterium]
VSGTPKESLLITTNEETEIEYLAPLSFELATADEIKQRVKDAGIVGQGGAAFPTFVKLSPPEGKKVDMVVINGAECEPYLTRDYRFMMERTEDVLRGLTLIMRAVGVTRGAIGIEDNKPDAIKALQSVVGRYPGITIEALPTKYPQGAEKMLIYSITKRVVPAGGLPMDVGVVVQNIGTAIAVLDAVVKGEPVLTAALTVTGRGIRTPKNLIVKIGTPIIEVINYCGGLTDDAVKVIVGGPMMGVAQYDLNAPVMKATSGIVVLAKGESEKLEEYPCVRCGKCVDVCPLFLMPTKIARYSQLGRPEDAEKLGVMVCMECGTCAFSCPSGIPLVQWIKRGKKEVLKLQRERQSGN